MGEKIEGVAMPDELKIEVSAEEKEADDRGLAEVKTDELRASLAEKYNIDSDNESELLDKLMETETEHRTRLNKTIKQKISWRDKVKGTSKKADKPAGDKPTGDKDELSFDEKFEARMAERDLKDLDLSTEVEAKVRSIAKVENISIREAAKHPYIKTVMEAEAQEKKVLDGTPKRNNKGTSRVSVDASKPLNHADFDFKTEEGRKVWEDAKKNRAEYRKNNS